MFNFYKQIQKNTPWWAPLVLLCLAISTALYAVYDANSRPTPENIVRLLTQLSLSTHEITNATLACEGDGSRDVKLTNCLSKKRSEIQLARNEYEIHFNELSKLMDYSLRGRGDHVLVPLEPLKFFLARSASPDFSVVESHEHERLLVQSTSDVLTSHLILNEDGNVSILWLTVLSVVSLSLTAAVLWSHRHGSINNNPGKTAVRIAPRLSSSTELKSKNTKNTQNLLLSAFGFEMRTLLSTLSGNLRLLENKIDPSNAFYIEEMARATRALAGVSDGLKYFLSFNRGVEETTSLYDVYTDFCVFLSTQCVQNGIRFDAFTATRLPETFDFNRHELYWLLHMHFGPLQSRCTHPYQVFYAEITHSEESGHIQVAFHLTTLKEWPTNIKSLLDIQWGAGVSESLNNFHQAILQTSSKTTANARNYEQVEGEKYSLYITHPSAKLPHQNLSNKKIGVCGAGDLRASILEHTLRLDGAQVTWIHQPADLLSDTHKVKDLDAIFIADCTPGIELGSFCKTLRNRLDHAKLTTPVLMSTADPADGSLVQGHVHAVFYRPTNPLRMGFRVATLMAEGAKQAPKETERALLIDDDKVTLFILSELVSNVGLQVDKTREPLKVMEMIESGRYSVIYLDCVMPGMSGFELARAIRKREEEVFLPTGRQRLSIIGCTALYGEEETAACFESGMDQVIHKPFSFETVQRVTRAVLSARN